MSTAFDKNRYQIVSAIQQTSNSNIYRYSPQYVHISLNRNANKVLMYVINFRFCFHLPHVQPFISLIFELQSEHIKYNWSYS